MKIITEFRPSLYFHPNLLNMIRGGRLVALLVSVCWLTGCAMLAIPVPADKRAALSGRVIDRTDVEFVTIGVTTRDELIQRLGHGYRTSGRRAPISYSWEKRGGDIYYAGTFIIPTQWGLAITGGGTGKDSKTWSYWRGFFVEFDEQDRVRRFEFVKLDRKRSIDEQRDQWGTKASQKR